MNISISQYIHLFLSSYTYNEPGARAPLRASRPVEFPPWRCCRCRCLPLHRRLLLLLPRVSLAGCRRQAGSRFLPCVRPIYIYADSLQCSRFLVRPIYTLYMQALFRTYVCVCV